MRAYSPTGNAIIGTAEIIPGTALIADDSFRKAADGRISFDHEGETKIFWDAQEATQALGETVYVDEDGAEWLEREIELRPE